LLSTKLALLVKVGVEAVAAGPAAVAGVGVMEAVVEAVEDEVEAVVAVAVVEVAAVAVTAVIAGAVAAVTVAGNRLPIIKICNETGEPAVAGSPVLFSANLLVVKLQVLFYAFPRKFLWLPYTSKTSPKSFMRRSVAARELGAARSPRKSLPCSKKTSPRRKN
jgi:hypothetical protein